jgi:N-acetylneuraminate synthase
MTDFIAEVCSNHNGNLNRALTLIDTAAEIGCSAVKFQLFKLDKLFAPEVLTHPDYEFVRERRAWELPLEWLPALANRARQRGVKFGVTPFYVEAVDELLPYVDFFKIASYSLLHDELLVKVARTGKPVILSTGMATDWEIRGAVEILKDNKCDRLTVLHCVSGYPTPTDQVNPGKLIYMSQAIVDQCNGRPIDFGWSDHSVKPEVLYYLCIKLNGLCSTVEFHLDLDSRGVEYVIGHCWLPRQIQVVIETIKQVHMVEWQGLDYVFGQSGLISPTEQKERLWRADPSDGLRPMREMRRKL